MLFIITEHATCNVCKEEMRGGGRGSQIGESWMAASLLLLLILLIHSQDHHELSEESYKI